MSPCRSLCSLLAAERRLEPGARDARDLGERFVEFLIVPGCTPPLERRKNVRHAGTLHRVQKRETEGVTVFAVQSLQRLELYRREAIEPRTFLLRGGRSAHAGTRAKIGVSAQQCELLVGGRAAHLAVHRGVQRVDRRERPRAVRPLCHPWRVFEHPADRSDEPIAVHLVEIGDGHGRPERYTVCPSTRTSRTLSLPAKVKIAASD